MLDYTVGSRFTGSPCGCCRTAGAAAGPGGRLRQETVRLLQLKGMKLAALDDKLESYSPLKVMNRGYSYCRDERGRIIRSVKGLKVGDLLRLTFKDGEARCRTEAVEEGTGDVGKS